jgi:transglutaminase-like putative cysteine protease
MPPGLDPRTIPWLLATALATLAPHAPTAPPWLAATVGSLLLWRAWLWWRNARLPGRWRLIALVVAGTAGIVAEYRTLFGQEAGVGLLTLFMALKLMELRRPRDATVVVMLGYFLLLTHYFQADGIPVGAWMLVALTVCTASLIQLQAPAAEPPRATLRRAALLIMQSLPMMAILFLLFPRIDGPLWGLPQDSRAATSGLTDRMSPGSISQLTQSTAIAFRASFAGPLPARENLYWRGPVLMDYDGQTWTPGGGLLPLAIGSTITPQSPPIAYTLTLEPHHQRWLLALDMPVQLPADSSLTPAFAAVRRMPVRERLRFEATSAVRYAAGVQENRQILQRALVLPEGLNPRAVALARSWRAPEHPQATVARALQYFREEKFAYTLNPPLLGRHAIDDFLFASRRGYCEHYAAAFVFLMRAAGIPARVVGGYQGGEINPVDGFLVVRQSDAHAWAEVWMAGRGWLRVDPTAAVAPSRVDQGVAAALPAGEALPGLARGNLEWLRDLRYQNLLSWLGLSADWRSLIAALAGFSGLALLLLALWTMRQRAPRDPVQRLWQQFCRRMARLGVPRHAWEGPLDYAARIRRERPTQGDLAEQFGRTYAGLRYGPPGPAGPKPQLITLRRLLQALPRR